MKRDDAINISVSHIMNGPMDTDSKREVIKHLRSGERLKPKQIADEVICPHCNEEWNVYDNDVARFNLCPKCGGMWDEEVV